MRIASALRRGEVLLREIGRSRAWLPVALVLILIPYAWVSLWPLDWAPPREVENGAAWNDAGDLVFRTPGLAVTPAPLPWLGWVRRTNRLQVELRIRPFELGPGTIFTISDSIHARNLIVEQRGSAVVIRLRTACRGALVADWDCDVVIHERDVFAPGVWVDLQVQIVPGRFKLLVGEGRLAERDLPAMPLRVWDDRYRLAIGSEAGGNRGWLGEVAHAGVRTPGFVGDYANPSKLDLPPEFRFYDREPKLVPFEDVTTKDVARNAIMYAPMGIALALLGLWPGRLGVLRAGLAIGLVSLSMETAQLFISHRNPSVTDLILNLAGGTIGFQVFRWFRKPPTLPSGPSVESQPSNPR